MFKTVTKLATVSMIAMMAGISAAEAQAIRAGFDTSTLAPNDDGSTGAVDIGFNVNFFGVNASQLFVNNNGNVTLDSALSTFTPFDLTSTGRQIIAPFFADVDTGDAGSPVTYGQGTVGANNAFGVNWVDVDYFNSSVAHTNRNSFQLVLIDQGGGDFIIEFNYDQIQWEAGAASGGDANGLGGSSARAGFSNGTGAPGTFFELPGSAVNGAFLDSGPAGTALVLNSLDSTVLGRYIFLSVGGGIVVIPIGNDGGIMATESAVMATQQADNLRQVLRANSGARELAAKNAQSDAAVTVMGMNGPSTGNMSVWARVGGGVIHADFGDDLRVSQATGQGGIEFAATDSLTAGLSIGGVRTAARTGGEDLDGDGLFVEPYVAFMDGGLSAIASFIYTYTDYKDTTGVIDSGNRFAGTLTVAYDVPVSDGTMVTPFGFVAGGIETLDTSAGDEDLDFVIGRVGVELSRSSELLNTGTMNVYGSIAAEYVSTNDPGLAPAAVLSAYDDSRLGARVEAGLDFTIAGTGTQFIASVHGAGLFTDAPGVGGNLGIKIPF